MSHQLIIPDVAAGFAASDTFYFVSQGAEWLFWLNRLQTPVLNFKMEICFPIKWSNSCTVLRSDTFVFLSIEQPISMLANMLHLVLVADWCESSPVQRLRLRQQQQPATQSQLKCLCWPRGPVRRCHIPAPRPILSGAFIKDEMQPIDLRGHFGHTNEQLTCVSAHEMNNAWKLVAHVVPLWARRWPAHGHTQEVIRLSGKNRSALYSRHDCISKKKVLEGKRRVASQQ